jgi:pyruvate dehydrogenase E1 component
VRGNGKIIQELEGEFRGSGWNVIKLIWGKGWDELLARDKTGKLKQLMMETLDGDYQAMKANDGAFVRKNFFGRYPETLKLVEHMTDEEIFELRRGGHQPEKVYAAFHAAHNTKTGQPTVLLVKTVKGYGMGKAGEGKNTVHQTKKLSDEDIKYIRDRFSIPIPDSELPKLPYYKPAEDTPEMRYLHERRKALGGYLPKRRAKADEQFTVPALETFKAILEPTAEGREISTTQAYVRFVTQLLRDQALGPRVVPILVDEARTFGMEGLFRQIGIYNPKGQLYTPVDKDQVMYYREDKAGQILQEGINEAGGMASWIAAATSYSTSNRIMVPFYVYYSMFGFQRIGDLAWAAGDMQARGFLLGGTSGRTTLNGEGLQHEDGHSHILAGTIPNCVSYDPTFAHEVAVILHHGLKRMVEKQENVYLLHHPAQRKLRHAGPDREGTEEQIIKGMYLAKEGPNGATARPLRVRHRACNCWAAAPSCARAWRRKSCWPWTGAWPPMCGAAPASTNWPATARTASAGTCCTRWRRRASPSWRSSSTHTPARWWPRPTT